MMHKIKNWYSGLKLKSKIAILMLTLLLILCALLFTINLCYFTYQYRIDSENSAKKWMDVSLQNINQTFDSIYTRIVELTVSPGFSSVISNILTSRDNQLQSQIDLQDFLTEILKTNMLITNTYIIDKNNNIYHRFDDVIQLKESKLLDFNSFRKLRGVNLLAEENSVFSKTKKIIPIAIPYNFLDRTRYLELSNNSEPEFFIIIFLDRNNLFNDINISASAFFNSRTTLEFNSLSIFQSNFANTENWSKFSRPTNIPNLFLTMEIDKDSFLPQRKLLIVTSFIAFALIISISIIAISKISTFLTNPFSQMIKMIKNIQNNTYDLSVKPKYKDETGTLIRAINTMYVTLNKQIDTIKEEEKLKYYYMSLMLANQINPHFIYNTLETINMEIINSNYEIASTMIQDFAIFLRCSLNNGNDTTTIEKEIKQVSSYLAIMNRRLNSKVNFEYSVNPKLNSIEIPKLILQPLVENSIIHGFNNGYNFNTAIIPAIEITIEGTKSEFEISISDNGVGIDIEKVEKMLQETDKPTLKENVGLTNIYKRLHLFYKAVEINIESIPYFRNTITLTIHN